MAPVFRIVFSKKRVGEARPGLREIDPSVYMKIVKRDSAEPSSTCPMKAPAMDLPIT